jgi:hypothetical protein
MSIDWLHFTPWSALAGGALIGLAASLLIALNGRIAGISGLLAGALEGGEGRGEKALFILGLVLAPLLRQGFAELPAVQLDSSAVLLGLAGLLVGFGSRYGAGCTSGHGVCGLARLSPRSLLATLCFMASGFVTVFILRHVWGV